MASRCTELTILAASWNVEHSHACRAVRFHDIIQPSPASTLAAFNAASISNVKV
jgi:hypothetical protein